jgi:hypothetical protein
LGKLQCPITMATFPYLALEILSIIMWRANVGAQANFCHDSDVFAGLPSGVMLVFIHKTNDGRS